MLQPVADKSHEMFYTQLLRWMVNDTPRRMMVSTPKQMLTDESQVKLRADVRDKAIFPRPTRQLRLTSSGRWRRRDGRHAPDPLEPASTQRTGPRRKPGSYVVETAPRGEEGLGRDTMTFRRDDGVAENSTSNRTASCWKSCRRKQAASITSLRTQTNSAKRSIIPRPESRCGKQGSVGYARNFPAAVYASLG